MKDENHDIQRHQDSASRRLGKSLWIIGFVLLALAIGTVVATWRQEKGSEVLSRAERQKVAEAGTEITQNPIGASGLSNVSVSGAMQAEWEVSPQALFQNPQKYFGLSVSVYGRVARVISTNTFVLGPAQGDGDGVFVVGGAVQKMQPGQLVTVKGSVLEYDKRTLAREAGQPIPTNLPPMQDKVIAIASTSVTPSKDLP